ncbi:hypothetical protein GF354_06595 [Candidatus Peregrinibacteria bacterium]|nr:hypothetical protein [Candidatus Peregrinibacteria bacterium]
MGLTYALNHFWPAALFSFFISFGLIYLCVKIFPKIGLMDNPGKYGLSRAPIPYFGGIALFLAILSGILIFIDLSVDILYLILSASIIFVVGFFDDYLDLNPLIRLIFQFIACIVLVYAGIGILSINFPFLGILEFTQLEFVLGGQTIYLISAVFTIFWVMLIINAMNLLDGVSGLTSGISSIAAFTIFFLSIHPIIHENPYSQVNVAILALIVAFSALVFLFFDFPKPRILMGDSGSTLLGFFLAVLAIVSGGKVATAFLVLGIPLLDMVWVILRRTFYEKKPFWKGDLKHLHHRLLDLGFSRRRVLILYYLITAILGCLAVAFVSSNQKFFIALSLIIFMLLLAGALIFIPRKKKSNG